MDSSVFQHSSTDLATSVIDAIEILTDKKLQDAKFDRTIQATVLSCTSNTKGEYRCRYQDSKFLAYAPNPDVTYSENALVYVLIPGNDWGATKTIIGTVDKLGVDYIANISNKEYFDPIGDNVIENQDYVVHLNTWDCANPIVIYDAQNEIDLIGLNEEKVKNYFKDPNANYFYIQAAVQSSIEDTQKLGRYGFRITTTKGSKESLKDGSESDRETYYRTGQAYYYTSEDMEGEPRHYTIYSIQNNLRKPFIIETKIENNEESNDFGEIIKIEVFGENFTQEEGHDPDVHITNIQMTALHRLSEMDMTDGYLSIVTPVGSVFYKNGSMIVPSKLYLNAKVRMNGIVSDDPDIKYYWFRRDVRVFGGSDYEQYYCPISGANTNGWKCLNDSEMEGAKRLWRSATNELMLLPANIPCKELLFKCVAIYDDIVLEREITIKNQAADYEIALESSAGKYVFSEDGATTELRCVIDWGSMTPTTNIKYYWAEVSSEGIYNSKNWGETSETIFIDTIKGFAKYFCSIYTNDDEFLGTGYCVLSKIDLTAGATMMLNITNGNQYFKYDADGISPTSSNKDIPQPLLPLEVEFYDTQGKQLSAEEVARSTHIVWYIPANNTMLIPPDPVPEPIPDPVTGILYYQYEDRVALPFDIVEYYSFTAIQNQIRLAVEYNGVTYIDKTTFDFTQDGESGTNGTTYSCKIIPNSTQDFNYSRVWIIETPNAVQPWKFNFNYDPNSFPFKVVISRNGEHLYEGYTGNDIYGVKWEISFGDANSFYSINNNVFTYNGFPNEIPNTFNNLLKVTVDIKNERYRIIYAFLPIGVVKYKNISYDYDICLYQKDGFYSGYTQVLYNTDGENPRYGMIYPWEPKVYDNSDPKVDITDNYSIETSLIGTTLRIIDDTQSQKDIIPYEYYDGKEVGNAVYFSCPEFIIYAPVIVLINRYGLASLNAWDGTKTEIGDDYIYAPYMGAGKKWNDNTFSGVLLGNVHINGQTEDKIGFMAYGHSQRTVWIDAETGRSEFGVGNGKIIFDPTLDEGEQACIYGGNYDPDAGTGMIINLSEPYIKWGNENFIVDKDGLIKAIRMELKRPGTTTTYYSINQYGFLLDVAISDPDPDLALDPPGTYDNPYPPGENDEKFIVYNSGFNPNNSYIKGDYKTNSIAEFGNDGCILQSTKGSYLYIKDVDDHTDLGPNTALTSANALYLRAGLLQQQPPGIVEHPLPPIDDPGDEEEYSHDENYRTNASATMKAKYNCNIWAGHGLSLRVTGPHDRDNSAENQNWPAANLNNSYGYMKLETQYGWIYLSSKAGGKKNTPGIGINAYSWKYRQQYRGESENDPYGVGQPGEGKTRLAKGTPYPNEDYKVYINGNEVLTNGNAAESTGGDLGGAVYVSEFGNLRPYLDRLVSLGSYYEEGDGIAAWRHVVTYDTIQVSDKREKEDIEDMDSRYVDFIMKLRPKRYHYKKTGEKEFRTGFIAQEVEEDLEDTGLKNEEFGGLKKKPINMYGDTVDYGYGLNYDDFVAALVLTVQDLQKQINELKEKKYGT